MPVPVSNYSLTKKCPETFQRGWLNLNLETNTIHMCGFKESRMASGTRHLPDEERSSLSSQSTLSTLATVHHSHRCDTAGENGKLSNNIIEMIMLHLFFVMVEIAWINLMIDYLCALHRLQCILTGAWTIPPDLMDHYLDTEFWLFLLKTGYHK